MVIIPMAGKGSRFYEQGYTVFKPFLPLGSKTVIECVIDNLGGDALLITRKEHAPEAEKYGKVITVPSITEGSACTLQVARDHMIGETIIASCDQLVDIDIRDFLFVARNYDACIMTFNSNESKWSYVNEHNNLVTEVAEKIVISEKATTGIYYCKEGRDYIKYSLRMIEDCYRVNGEYCICPVFNWYPRNKKIGIYHIESRQMHGLGTPEDYEHYIRNA